MSKAKRFEATTNLFNALPFIRTFYTEAYEEIDKEYKETKKSIEENMKVGSPMFKQKMAEAEQTKADRLAEKKTKAIDLLMETTSELEELEKAYASVIDVDTMAKLDRLSIETLTKAEIDVLASQYGGKNYWIDRKLCEIANKSGVTSLDMELEPNLDKKLGIIAELGDNMLKFLADYDGTPQYKTAVLVADSVLERARTSYTNNLVGGMMSDFETARSTFANITSQKNDFEKAVALSRAYQNANENVKNMLIAKSSCERTIDDVVLNMSGMADLVNTFRTSGSMAQYEKAEKLMSKAMVTKEPEAIADMLISNSDNKFFKDMVSSEAKVTEKFQSAKNITQNIVPDVSQE